MKTFIRSAACISPQNTVASEAGFLNGPVEYGGNRLNCIEPDYNALIDPKLSRRMSRIIKMSVAAALSCLKQAGLSNPQAIVTGTAYGCLEDTGTFLANMVEYKEEPLSPVAFVQSTHNTIGAQIALLLKCSCYNNTFVNGGLSFENALLDAIMLLSEGTCNVLVGGMDEVTDMSYAVLSRTGMYRRTPVSNFDLFSRATKGTIAGEGASFFLLAGTPSENDLSCIEAIYTFYQPADLIETIAQIKSFLCAQSVSIGGIDLLITGNNGDTENDEVYLRIRRSLFNEVPSVNYKNLCGEYPTSVAFALWMGANIVKGRQIPDSLQHDGKIKDKIDKVLIYNHYQNIYHSLILISSC